jgi:hypothetical protein
MLRLSIAIAAFFAGAALASQAIAAGIDQNGDFLYTFTSDYGGRVHSHTRQLNPHQMDKMSERAAGHLGRFRDLGRDCSPGGSSGDRATLNQSGTGNTAWVSQTGHNDGAAISQTGDDNASYTLQSGNGLQASTLQAGSHNLAVSVQSCRSPRSVLMARFLEYNL